MAVGWTLPGGKLERPIPGSRLSKFEISSQTVARLATEPNEDEFLHSQINVYPNPFESANTRLIVGGYRGLTKQIETDLEIINMTGEVVFAEQISCGGDCSDYLVNLNKQLAPGVYLVTLKTNGLKKLQRLVVK